MDYFTQKLWFSDDNFRISAYTSLKKRNMKTSYVFSMSYTLLEIDTQMHSFILWIKLIDVHSND